MEIVAAVISFISMVVAAIAAYISWNQSKKARIRNSRQDRESLFTHIENTVTSTEGKELRVQLIEALSYQNHDDPRWAAFPKKVQEMKRGLDRKIGNPKKWNNYTQETGMSDSALLFHNLKTEMKSAIKETYSVN